MSRFNIVLVRPRGYLHSDALLDVAKLLHCSLESLGFASAVGYNSFDSSTTNIVLGYHLLRDPSPVASCRSILYQLEQLSDREGWFTPPRLEILRAAAEVWDYAPENVRFLAANGLSEVKLLPIGFHERLSLIPTRPAEDIDILFYGSINDRRKRVLDQLARGFRTQVLFGVYGSRRDEYISRSKLVLNVHFYDRQLMEQPRIAYLLNNRRFVLSEAAANNPFAGAIAVAPYDELVHACRKFLDDEPARARIVGAGHELLRTRSMPVLLRAIL